MRQKIKRNLLQKRYGNQRQIKAQKEQEKREEQERQQFLKKLQCMEQRKDNIRKEEIARKKYQKIVYQSLPDEWPATIPDNTGKRDILTKEDLFFERKQYDKGEER